MRLWSIDPKYLDSRGLLAAWREGLLAKSVLEGKTRGYKQHPQLNRFKESGDGIQAILKYLVAVYNESKKRGYHFNPRKLGDYKNRKIDKIKVTSGQVTYEFELLKWKLLGRSKEKLKDMENAEEIVVNPIFEIIDGEIEKWEKVKPEIQQRIKNKWNRTK